MEGSHWHERHRYDRDGDATSMGGARVGQAAHPRIEADRGGAAGLRFEPSGGAEGWWD
jgi:hypothetical protein